MPVTHPTCLVRFFIAGGYCIFCVLKYVVTCVEAFIVLKLCIPAHLFFVGGKKKCEPACIHAYMHVWCYLCVYPSEGNALLLHYQQTERGEVLLRL